MNIIASSHSPGVGMSNASERLIPEIDRLIDQHGLNRIKQRIIKSMKPSVELWLNPPQDVGAVGVSRFGGMPDLPSPDLWPTLGRVALTFIGQINLGDVHVPEADATLPCEGLLSFFYDAEGWPDATSSNPAGWRVLYFSRADDVRLVDRAPKLLPMTLPPWDLSFVPTVTVPAPRSIELDQLDLADEDFDRYWDFRNAVWMLRCNDGNNPLHRMLGHPDAVQGCMQRTVQFASRGLKLPEGVYSYYEHPRAAELIPGAHDWRLLLQVDSDERLKVMWGDAGRVYYWIHKADLQAKEFSRVWVFMQCG